ncbi:MAG: 3-phosphoshikimate 1-carboxyvinyltransferase [Calditrichaceae bacterium]
MYIVKGDIALPGDKSISHRAALFSALNHRKSMFNNFNLNKDCAATLDILRKAGIDWELSGSRLIIKGKPLDDWKMADNILDARNSGTTARLMSGILSNLDFSTILQGDDSLSKRPMKRVLDPLAMMGAKISSENGHLPLKFSPGGKLHGITYRLPVASAQVKSALLLAGMYADGETNIIEPVRTRDHTERLMRLPVKRNPDGSQTITSSGEIKIPDISMTIPGDISSASFFIAAALILPGSELILRDVSLNPTRDGILRHLKKMNAKIDIDIKVEDPEPMGDLTVRYSELHNAPIDIDIIPNIIDELPILAVIGSQADGIFEIRGAEELRYKESDRIRVMAENLESVGIKVLEKQDGMTISGGQVLKGGSVKTHGDHRIAMSFAIAGLFSKEKIVLDDPSSADVSFPQFWSILDGIIT